MRQLSRRWLPEPKIQHLWPAERVDVRTRGRTQCVRSARWDLSGGAGQPASLTRPFLSWSRLECSREGGGWIPSEASRYIRSDRTRSLGRAAEQNAS
jgi:hypothetical protein